MADLTQTPANVVPVSGATLSHVTAGEAVDAGMPVYRAVDGRYNKAQTDTAAKAAATGVAVNSAAGGQPLTIQTAGNLALGATLVKGETYFVSGTAGKIQPSGDVGTTEYVTRLGFATDVTNLELDISASGVAHA
jgi:hypothetical protein